jgi:hypothetical protein
MNTASVRGLLLATAMLCALAVAATPANATFTPPGAAVSASSTNTQLQAGGITVRCPTSTATGTIDANGLGITLSVFFSSNPTTRVTCTESLLGSSVTVTTNGRISIVSIASVAGVSSSDDLVIPAGSSFVVRSLAGTRTYGPQTARNCITFNQATQTLNVRCTIVDTGGNAATFTGSYVVTPRADRRPYTIS